MLRMKSGPSKIENRKFGCGLAALCSLPHPSALSFNIRCLQSASGGFDAMALKCAVHQDIVVMEFKPPDNPTTQPVPSDRQTKLTN